MAEMKFDYPAGKNSFVMTADGVLDEDLCAKAISKAFYYYSNLFENGPTWAGVRSLVKNTRDWTIESGNLKAAGVDEPIFDTLRLEAQRAMHLAISQYIEEEEGLWWWPGRGDTGFRMQHYYQGAGFYRTHCDGTPWERLASGGENQRVLGAIIYLNTVDVGGGTNFPQHNLIVPAKAGRIALFPAAWTHRHAGMTPLSSDKWILSSFITAVVERDEIPQSSEESELTPLKDATQAEDEKPENDE
jgi:hypothetical protein